MSQKVPLYIPFCFEVWTDSSSSMVDWNLKGYAWLTIFFSRWFWLQYFIKATVIKVQQEETKSLRNWAKGEVFKSLWTWSPKKAQRSSMFFFSFPFRHMNWMISSISLYHCHFVTSTFIPKKGDFLWIWSGILKACSKINTFLTKIINYVMYFVIEKESY